tara:strand:- start:600 stop:962 length:363 start_codon:yes stop_codon:yes gene_type:complete
MDETQTEYWSLEELTALTDTVQSKEIEYQGKMIKIQWMELSELEEPKKIIPDDSLDDDSKNEFFQNLAKERVTRMISKANEKNPIEGFLTDDVWHKLPTTLKWTISGTILQTNAGDSEDF